MIESIAVENYKNLGKLEISGLTRLTLIGGENNCGKSSLLEAVALALDPANEVVVTALFRGLSLGHFSQPWLNLFANFQNKQPIRITLSPIDIHLLASKPTRADLQRVNQNPYLPREAVLNGTNSLFLQSRMGESQEDIFLAFAMEKLLIHTTLNSQPNIAYITGNTPLQLSRMNELFSAATMQHPERLEMILDLLSRVDSAITGMQLLSPGSTSMPYLSTTSGLMFPAMLQGDGIKRLFIILLHLVNLEGGILLVDEIDHGLHHSSLVQFWQAISRVAAAMQCQVLASTHSYECLAAACQGCKEIGEDLTYIRLDRDNQGNLNPKIYPFDLLESAMETRWEIR
ncbi:MAG: AAA family ATPase [Magnetococcales bacterium]|nr:AAA family ATPase [Magnetococcales bacterium]